MGKLLIFTVILLLFLPSVAAVYRVKDAERRVLCRECSREELMRGEDEPGKLRIFLIPGDIVDINSASKRELELLPGVGEVIAERIIAYREEKGNFTDIRQLLEIEGMDEACLAELAPMLIAGDYT